MLASWNVEITKIGERLYGSFKEAREDFGFSEKLDIKIFSCV